MRVEVATPQLGARQFGRNIAANVAAMMVSLASGFFLAPFLIRRVGIAGYGLVPLAYGLSSYLTVVNIALNAASGRNLSVAITRRDYARAQIVFSTSLWASIAAGGVLFGVGGVASLLATRIMNVPVGYERDAGVLLLTATANVVLVLVSSPLSIAIYYSNRLDKKAWFDAASRLVYLASVVMLVSFVAPRPAMVGFALLASAGMSFAQNAIWWRRHMPWLRPTAMIRLEVLRELAWFGGWSLVAYTGSTVFLTLDLVLVNRMIGPVEGGVYAALLQWAGVIRMFATTVSSVFSQPMAHVFAKDGLNGLAEHALRAVRVTGVLLVIPVVAIGGSAEPLVRLWLGQRAAMHWPILVLLVLPLASTLMTAPLITALQTVLVIRPLGIATCAAALIDAGLAVALVKLTAAGMYGVAAAAAMVGVLLGAVFIPVFAARVLGRSPFAVLGPILRVAIVSAGASGIGQVVVSRHVSTWWQLGVHAFLLCTMAGAAAFLWLLERDERTAALTALLEYRARLVGGRE